MLREFVDTSLGQLRNAAAAGKRWAIGTTMPSSHVRPTFLIFIALSTSRSLRLESTPYQNALAFVRLRSPEKGHIICVGGKEPMVCFAAALGRALIWHRMQLYRI